MRSYSWADELLTSYNNYMANTRAHLGNIINQLAGLIDQDTSGKVSQSVPLVRVPSITVNSEGERVVTQVYYPLTGLATVLTNGQVLIDLALDNKREYIVNPMPVSEFAQTGSARALLNELPTPVLQDIAAGLEKESQKLQGG